MAYSYRRRRRFRYRRMRRRMRFRRRTRKWGARISRARYRTGTRYRVVRAGFMGFPRSVMPATFFRRLRYCYTANFNFIDSQLLGVYTFRANSLFDPDASGTGHQPYGLDQLDPFYSRVTCLGSRIRVTFNNNDSVAANVGIIHSPYSSLSNDYAYNLQAESHVIVPVTPGWSRTVTSAFSVQKFYSLTNIMDNVVSFSVTVPVSANPLVMTYYHLVYNTPDTAGITAEALGFTVCIDYYAMYDLPVRLTQSN